MTSTACQGARYNHTSPQSMTPRLTWPAAGCSTFILNIITMSAKRNPRSPCRLWCSAATGPARPPLGRHHTHATGGTLLTVNPAPVEEPPMHSPPGVGHCVTPTRQNLPCINPSLGRHTHCTACHQTGMTQHTASQSKQAYTYALQGMTL